MPMQPTPPPIVPPAPPAIVAPAPAAIGAPAPLAGAWIPEPRPWGQAAWLARHDAFVAQAQARPVDVLFLGDSISAHFPTGGGEVWQREIEPLGNVVDFGIDGDRTQFVLWRAQHGELDGTNARVVVLMIGTNNLATSTPENIARGVAAIVATVHEKLPNAIIVLNAILPRGPVDGPARAAAADTNARIQRLADGTRVRWLDPGAGFLDPAGKIDPALMPDLLHPSATGYGIWAAALRPVLLGALGK
jgi:lysophospholipase L1-like esterase